MRKRFVVTQKDIDTGKRMNSCECPVVKSIMRGLKIRTVELVRIMGQADRGYYLWIPHTSFNKFPWIHQKVEKKVAAFIDNFDHEFPVKPFTFYLEVPE